MKSPSIFLLVLTLLSAIIIPTHALTQEQLRHRSIYQVLTDRFARSDGRWDAPCDLGARDYCGGDWKGIEGMLGYIQGMGFDTGE
jgi:alpha-amylase